MDHKDIFKRACLLQYSTSIWQCSRALDPNILKKIENNEWLRGRKYLINPELLGPVRTSVQQARNKIQSFSVPFPITSIYMVPKDSIKILDDILKSFKDRFWEKVNEFISVYDDARKDAETCLGQWFDEAEYPMDITSKFKFEWRFLTISLPGKNSILTPDIYESEKEKFQVLMNETRELAMEALRGELSGLVGHLVERLNGNGNKKMINHAMFNKLNQFLDEFAVRNIFDDQKLVELADQAKGIISGVSGFGIKYNTELRDKITSEMKQLKEAIDLSMIEDLPMRRIILSDTPESAVDSDQE